MYSPSASIDASDPLERDDVKKIAEGFMRRRQNNRNERMRAAKEPVPESPRIAAEKAVSKLLLYSYTKPDDDIAVTESSSDESADYVTAFDMTPNPQTPQPITPTPILPKPTVARLVQRLLNQHRRKSELKLKRNLSRNSDRFEDSLDSYRQKVAHSLEPFLKNQAENDPRLPQLLHDEWLKLSMDRTQRAAQIAEKRTYLNLQKSIEVMNEEKTVPEEFVAARKQEIRRMLKTPSIRIKKAEEISKKGTYQNMQRARELMNQEKTVPEEVVAARNQKVRQMLKEPSQRMVRAQQISKKGTYQNMQRARELMNQKKLVSPEVVAARNEHVKKMLEVDGDFGEFKQSTYKFQAPPTSCKEILFIQR